MLLKQFEDKALQIRLDILNAIKKAGKGHIGGSFSIIEILVTLFHGGIINYDSTNPKWNGRDRFILSKGHAGVALYAILSDLGFFSKEKDLLLPRNRRSTNNSWMKTASYCSVGSLSLWSSNCKRSAFRGAGTR